MTFIYKRRKRRKIQSKNGNDHDQIDFHQHPMIVFSIYLKVIPKERKEAKKKHKTRKKQTILRIHNEEKAKA